MKITNNIDRNSIMGAGLLDNFPASLLESKFGNNTFRITFGYESANYDKLECIIIKPSKINFDEIKKFLEVNNDKFFLLGDYSGILWDPILQTFRRIGCFNEDSSIAYTKLTTLETQLIISLLTEDSRTENEKYLIYLEKTLEEYKQKTIVRGSNFIFKGSGYRTENILSEIEDEINYIKGKLNREERDRKSKEFSEKLELLRKIS